jgi:hypothetical protein
MKINLDNRKKIPDRGQIRDSGAVEKGLHG